MAETQRAPWILSMPDCAQMDDAMQELSGVNFHTSGQHKEDGETRRQRASKDTHMISKLLSERDPLVDDRSVKNTETGVTAGTTVNVDKANKWDRRF